MSAIAEIQDVDVKGTELSTDPEAAFKQTAVHLESGQSAGPGHAVEFTGRQFGTVRALDDQGKHILIPQPSDVSGPHRPYTTLISILIVVLLPYSRPMTPSIGQTALNNT